MKILMFGDTAIELPEGAEIVQGDIHNFEIEENEYDMIYCINVLAEIPRTEVLVVLRKFTKAVKPMGEVHIYTPNAEYACKLIFKNQINSMIPFIMLYGSDKPFHSCFTILTLRALMENAGLVVRAAHDGFYSMTNVETKEVMHIPQHIILGVKFA